MLRFFLAMASAILLSLPAHAAVFNFAGAVDEAESFSFTQDGIVLTVTSGNFIDPANLILPALPGQTVTRNGNGLGVDRFDIPTPFGTFEGDPPEINGATDLLILSFDRTVRFTSLAFGEVDDDDDFDLALDGVFVLEDINIAASNPFLFGPGFTGTTLAIGADTLGGVFGGGDDFRVLEIEISAVPLPASLPLLLGGLAGFGLLSRKRLG